ncbi:uncharacterized protein TRIVIDRAFT_215912 [Trichoderma virens Gv29-8]|uniref:Uncharacterized protein n=1 Tax=Hypocrea virens (strain Gv29-8 / FGSC 10586) TaxID=413071 RepID=G9MPS5_HYPVG|nr:uncharacterized protein TRIVIDRAFT_215912 [Trichoderma virens Gv29-8]EHK23875.1 hypothetical protein TRIVIDRAFT_215912 [Trichoderma virens Gv29-8]
MGGLKAPEGVAFRRLRRPTPGTRRTVKRSAKAREKKSIAARCLNKTLAMPDYLLSLFLENVTITSRRARSACIEGEIPYRQRRGWCRFGWYRNTYIK